MAALTLKGIPKETLERLRDMAAAQRRSLNQHAIYLLEQAAADTGDQARSAFDAFLQRRPDVPADGPEEFLPERDQSPGRPAPSFD